MATITAPGFPTVTPKLVMNYSVSRAVRSVVHDNIAPEPGATSVTLFSAGPRTGTLLLLFPDQDSATDCFNLHGRRLVFTFHHELRHTWDMTYVVAEGELELELEEDSKHFTVSIPFQEVLS